MAREQHLRFTSLTIRNWRNFREVRIDLAKRAFILGPNASGKSNLLDVFRFLAELAQIGSGGLQAAVARRGGLASLRCLHARRPSDVEIDATIGHDAAPDIWRYRLVFNAIRRGGDASVLEEHVWHAGAPVYARQHRDGGADELASSQTALEQVAANQDFRDLAAFLASSRYLHVVPQVVRDRARARTDGEDPFGGDLLRRMKSMPKKSREPRLRRVAQALQIAVPQFDGLALEDDLEGVPHLAASFKHWRATSSKQREMHFSDGTLRLIGLLWSIAEPGGPLLLEEPELSLNDAIVAQMPAMFDTMQRLSGRQVILTTHASALLDGPGIGLAELHILQVDENGTAVRTASDDEQLVAQIGGGLSVGEAVFPTLRPPRADTLGTIGIAA